LNLPNTILYTVIGIVASIALYFVVKPSLKRFFTKLKLESEFLDFLSLLVTLEASGLRLDEVLLEASRGKLLLPNPYDELSRKYAVLERVSSDPYTCLRTLAKTVPSIKVARFLEGYSEVLVSTNDTLRFVETRLSEEVKSLQARIESYASILDTLFESYLIILLGIIVYTAMPLIRLPAVLIGFMISLISLTALLIAFKLSSLTMYSTSLTFTLPTLILSAITPILIVVNPRVMLAHLLVTVVVGVILYYVLKGVVDMEREFELLSEELYAATRQGLPVDYSIVRIASSWSSGFLVKRVSDLLKLGVKPRDLMSVFNLPPLPKRVLELILAPIEYVKGSSRYIGFVLNIVESVKSLRRVLKDRGRMYTVYILILLAVTLTLARVLGKMGLVAIGSDMVRAVLYTSVFESIIIASTISTGYWFKDPASYALLVLNSICTLTLL